MSYPIVDLPRPYPMEYGFRLYDYVLEQLSFIEAFDFL